MYSTGWLRDAFNFCGDIAESRYYVVAHMSVVLSDPCHLQKYLGLWSVCRSRRDWGLGN
jgi:hypothetical protein